MKTERSLVWPVLACLFTALIIMGATFAKIPIPWTLVEIYLANFFVILAALLLGPIWGTASVLLYILLGILGLPIFSRGASGLAAIAGPTGGFILGYIPMVLAMGIIGRIGKRSWWILLIAAVVGELILFGIGVPWFKAVFRTKDAHEAVSWSKALILSCYPFLPGDALKVAIAVPVARRLGPWLEDVIGKRK